MTTDAMESAGKAKGSRRPGRPRALAVAVESVTKPIFGRRGLADGAIVRNWEAIVGAEFAAFAAPEKLAFPTGERRGGTLHLTVANGSVATQIQHREPVIVERINGYFGYNAVAQLRIRQGPVANLGAVVAEERPALDAAGEAELAESLAGVEDADLRAVLESLGRSVIARSRKDRRR